MILVSKFMVHRALTDKTYLLLGLLFPLKSHRTSYRAERSGSSSYRRSTPNRIDVGAMILLLAKVAIYFRCDSSCANCFIQCIFLKYVQTKHNTEQALW